MADPQLIVQDFGGKLSEDMDVTRARLLKGGSWKRQNIVVVIPSDEKMHAKVALSLCNMIFPPNNGVVRILALGCEVGQAYSSALDQILAHPVLKDFQFLLTIEHDNLPPSDGVIQLLETLEEHQELAAVSGLYFCKQFGPAHIWGDVNDPIPNFRPQVPVSNKLIECVGLSMGFTLFRLSMFKDEKLPRPFFQTKKGSGGCATQDLSFWSTARPYGYRCAVDCRVRVGHIDNDGFVW